MTKKLGDFTLEVQEGSFKNSQITVMLGENGTGKTTFIKMLYEAGKKKSTKDKDKDNKDKDVKEEETTAVTFCLH